MPCRASRVIAMKRILSGLAALGATFGSAFAAEFSQSVKTPAAVTYEAFGAVGDGVHDDRAAIVAAHRKANTEDYAGPVLFGGITGDPATPHAIR